MLVKLMRGQSFDHGNGGGCLSQIIATPVGNFQARWSNQGLKAFEFVRGESWSADRSTRTKHAQADRLLPQKSSQLQSTVAEYFRTGVFNWDLDLLDWQDVSGFHQQVLRACYEIPAGETHTYGQLAQQVGRPRAARAVGGAMAGNRWPLLIPCHRVVGSDGRLTGYSGTGGVQTKRWLLEMESRLTNSSDRGIEQPTLAGANGA